MIKTIIFDLGGVVLNRGLWKFREYMVDKFDVTNEQMIAIFIKKYYKQYFGGHMVEEDFWDAALSELKIDADWKQLKEKLLNFFEPNEGMFDLVKELRKKGFRTGLLSDQTREWWPYLDNKFRISNLFDEVIISYEEGVSKPDSKIYEIALIKLKAEPRETIFIDDLENNLPPAKKLGINTILFENETKLKIALKTFDEDL